MNVKKGKYKRKRVFFHKISDKRGRGANVGPTAKMAFLGYLNPYSFFAEQVFNNR